MSTHEPMSKVDTAWLRMERPTNLMMVTGVMVLADRLDVQHLRVAVAERFLAFPRFRQRVAELAGQTFWEDDHTQDLEWHVRRAALPAPAGKAELEEYVSNLASTPLDHGKPLWQFHLIEDYQGGSALVIRIHHCYADGIALVEVILALTDPDAGPHRVAKRKRKPKLPEGGVFDRLMAPARQSMETASHWVEQLMGTALEVAAHPQKSAEAVSGLVRSGAREGAEILRELVHSLSLPDDPQTCLKGPLGVFKRAAWCAPLPLDEVKAAGGAFGATVNDVLMACAAGAMRAYLLARGENLEGKTIRATVPVNLRPLEHARELGNHFGLVFLDLPVGLENPVERLLAVRASMQALKRSRQAIVSYGLLATLGLGPAFIQRPALEMLSRKASTVATNVPGPKAPIYLAGARVGEMMFWVPQSGTIAMGISILSYAGSVYFGLITDGKRVPDPHRIIDRFPAELEKLLLLALLAAGEGPIDGEFAERLVAAPARPRRRRASARKRRPSEA